MNSGHACPGAGSERDRRPPTARRSSLWVPLLLFTLVLVIHGLSPVLQSTDSIWSVHVALSVVREGNTDLDEYRDLVLARDRYRYEIVNGHIYSSFPIGTPLLAAPLVFLIDQGIRMAGFALPKAFRRAPHEGAAERPDAASFPRAVERLVASLIVAAAAVLIYFVGRQSLSPGLAAILAGLFAFCTPAWSTASRALWQHGPSMLMLAAALLLVLMSDRRPALVQYASLPLAFSFVVRPTNAISIAAFTLFVVMRRRQYLVRYLAWSLVVVVPFLAYNLAVYREVLAPYYSAQRVGATVHFAEALVGNLVSPGRGLFVFCPALGFSVYGVVRSLRSGGDHLLDVLLAGTLVLHWLVISSFPHWYGGFCFGPRFFSDVMPYFIYFLIPVLAWLSKPRGALRAWLVSSFVLLAVVSLLIHLSGAVNKDSHRWNLVPTSIDSSQERLWDWTDLQFLRGIVKGPVTTGNPGPDSEGGSPR